MTEAHKDIKKIAVFKHIEQTGNISKSCRYFGITRQAYYEWKRRYYRLGEGGLANGKPCPANPQTIVPPAIEEKILYLRRNITLDNWLSQGTYGDTITYGFLTLSSVV